MTSSRDGAVLRRDCQPQAGTPQYGQQIDALLEIVPIPENRDQLSSQIANIWAAADAVRMVCDDLKGPLDRLLSVLCNGDEEEPNDDNAKDDS
jgi:hypothetical protein